MELYIPLNTFKNHSTDHNNERLGENYQHIIFGQIIFHKLQSEKTVTLQHLSTNKSDYLIA